MFKEICFPLLGGLALFLFGMKTMELALHAWAGPYLPRFLRSSTQTPIHGMLFSAGMTAILQSSTAITVITIGLVNAKMIDFSRTLGIILGTNIGTCLTTELIGLNIDQFARPLLYISLAIWLSGALLDEYRPKILQWFLGWCQPIQFGSLAIVGFAFILLGMRWMRHISEPLQEGGLFTWFLERSSNSLLWALAAGIAVTALVHSSAAIIAMAMGLSATGVLPVEVGIVIMIGANIGTCFTAIIASIGSSKSGQLVAWAHVVLNMGGALLFCPFIPQLAQLSAAFSADTTYQIARAQTLFNVASSLLALPLCYLPVWSRIRT